MFIIINPLQDSEYITPLWLMSYFHKGEKIKETKQHKTKKLYASQISHCITEESFLVYFYNIGSDWGWGASSSLSNM